MNGWAMFFTALGSFSAAGALLELCEQLGKKRGPQRYGNTVRVQGKHEAYENSISIAQARQLHKGEH